MATLSDQVASEALKPLTVTVDGQTITRRSVADTIAGEQHVAAKTATTNRNPFFGLRTNIITPTSRGG